MLNKATTLFKVIQLELDRSFINRLVYTPPASKQAISSLLEGFVNLSFCLARHKTSNSIVLSSSYPPNFVATSSQLHDPQTIFQPHVTHFSALSCGKVDVNSAAFWKPKLELLRNLIGTLNPSARRQHVYRLNESGTFLVYYMFAEAVKHFGVVIVKDIEHRG